MTADLRASGPTDHTLVELTWREKRIEHRIRFGHIVDEQRLDRHRRIVLADGIDSLPGCIAPHLEVCCLAHGFEK